MTVVSSLMWNGTCTVSGTEPTLEFLNVDYCFALLLLLAVEIVCRRETAQR